MKFKEKTDDQGERAEIAKQNPSTEKEKVESATSSRNQIASIDQDQQPGTTSEKITEDALSSKDIEKMEMIGGLKTRYDRSTDMVCLYGNAKNKSEVRLLKNITIELTFPDGKVITLDGLDRKSYIEIPGKLTRAATNFSIKYRNILEKEGGK